MKTHFKFAYTMNLAKVLDNELFAMSKEIECTEDPDSLGLLDHNEQMHGIGFVVCQTFLTAVHKGKNKSASFSSGPFHLSGKSYAQITNACANFWKHSDEWERSCLSSQAKDTIEVLQNLGIDVWSSYPLSNAFHLLLSSSPESTYTQLLKFLNQWSCEIA